MMPRYLHSNVKAHPSHRRNSSGVILVVVLSFLVLITVVIIAFFGSVTTEAVSTKTYADGEAARQLADSTVELVVAQIKAATTTGTNIAWASQPGMIRTFDDTGAAIAYYKLYSSSTMVVSGSPLATFKPDGDLNPIWDTYPGLYTDLNSPVADASGTNSFPIIDPQALGKVQGFNYTDAITAGNLAGVNTAAADNDKRLPMPVMWLYQLKNGQLIAPDPGGDGKTLGFTKASVQPDRNNPIVGRIAFWTDDETCKVNTNTAGEGTYWDTPRFGSSGALNTNGALGEYELATRQPTLYEFQRYPGHPAGVALSPIFSSLTPTAAASIAPRIANGGSQAGTVDYKTAKPVDLSSAYRQALYASIDELMFADKMSGAQRTLTKAGASALTKQQLQAAKFFITANSRAPEVNLFNLPRMGIWPIAKDYADAPTSAAGQAKTTAFDRLQAFCSTLNGKPYYVQRQNNESAHDDYDNLPRNQQLFSGPNGDGTGYLARLTGRNIPGFGGSFLAKYPGIGGTSDRDQILTEIFDYIRCTNLFDANLGPRPTAGATSGSAGLVNKSNGYSTTNQFAKWKQGPSAWGTDCANYFGNVQPIHIGNTLGFGRTATIAEVAIMLICTGDASVTPANPLYNGWNGNDPTTNLTLSGTALKVGEKRYQAAVLLKGFSPAAGNMPGRPDLALKISNLTSIVIDGQQPFLSDTALLHACLSPATGAYGKYILGGEQTPIFMHSKSKDPYYDYANSKVVTSASNAIALPLQSNYLISKPFTSKSSTLSLACGTLAINVYQGHQADATGTPSVEFTGAPKLSDVVADDANNLIQTINVSFPAGPLPAPTLDTSGVSSIAGIPTASNWGFQYRLCSNGSRPALHSSGVRDVLWTGYDVIQSVSVSHGDVRLVAASPSVAASVFASRSGSTDSFKWGKVPISCYFPDNTDVTVGPITIDPGYSHGKLADIAAARAIYHTPFGIEKTTAYQSGDWDNGVGTFPGGSYINKPDEGDQNAKSGETPYYQSYDSDQVSMASTFYTPNRILPSPGMFGSLPTGVISQTPWQTLLFRPDLTHPQSIQKRSGQPPDHLFMDLFWMPMVEPYAISEPFSTAGKINLNYQIAPFTYITRNTALACLFKGEKLIAIPNTLAGSSGANREGVDQPQNTSLRLAIDVGDKGNASDPTGEIGRSFRQFKNLFTTGKLYDASAPSLPNGDIFRSPTQICDVFLVPMGQVWSADSTAQNFWKQSNMFTGDNSREKPYANLYARLTTKSNTYTVHYRVQLLKKTPSTASDQWVEGRDKVVGEYRGLTLVERYVDTSDSNLPDFATSQDSNHNGIPDNQETLDGYYRFRVLTSKKFVP